MYYMPSANDKSDPVDVRPDPIEPLPTDDAELVTGLPVEEPPSVLIPSIDEIKASVRARAAAADLELDRLRAERDELSALIRAAVVERDEAHRLYNALTPRGRR